MEVELIHSYGNNDFGFYKTINPEPTDDEIKIKTKFCGICRSDIAVYAGWEDPMPLGQFGHEGVGTVTKVGKNIENVKEGDFVATISDPAYGTHYNAKAHEFVKIPELSPKYIIQPVACAINIINKTIETLSKLTKNDHTDSDILIIGSGFMSMIIGQLAINEGEYHVDVVGNSHKDFWKNDIGIDLKSYDDIDGKKYNAIIDMTSKASTFDKIPKLASTEAIITMASTPFSLILTNFFQNSWNCHTLIFPSPRNKDFKNALLETRDLIQDGMIFPESLWTKEYSFKNAEQGFKDGVNRTKDYIRGYINFDI